MLGKLGNISPVEETLDHLKADIRTCATSTSYILYLREGMEKYGSKNKINGRRLNEFLNELNSAEYILNQEIVTGEVILKQKRMLENNAAR